MRYEFGGLTFGGAYTWRGLFSEFYGMSFLDGNAKETSGSCCYNYFFPSFFVTKWKRYHLLQNFRCKNCAANALAF